MDEMNARVTVTCNFFYNIWFVRLRCEVILLVVFFIQKLCNDTTIHHPLFVIGLCLLCIAIASWWGKWVKLWLDSNSLELHVNANFWMLLIHLLSKSVFEWLTLKWLQGLVIVLNVCLAIRLLLSFCLIVPSFECHCLSLIPFFNGVYVSLSFL